jgi:tetratricopeptide (TPR) repeat protein
LRYSHSMKFLRIIYFIFLIVAIAACSTKKNTWVARKYHNLTSHYNGFWAAQESMKEFETNTFKNYKDNYEKILPIFAYTTLEEVKTATPEMEKLYKKASSVIQYHSMLIRDVEYCSWIKNTYVLIGQTHFYKHDFFAGLEAFEYVVSKNKKHPYRFEAMMWMLRTYNETGLFSSSQGLIDLILDEKKFPNKYKSEFNAIVADFYLKQEDYAKSIEFLEPAFKLCKKRKLKARYAYILAQLYQKMGDGDNAVKFYDKSLDYGPGYDLAFNAKLNLAKSKALSGADAKQVKKMYLDMLAQEKYKDYQDQIYFSLAELCEKQKDEKDEEYYLVQSVKLATKNKHQKGLSSLKIGDLYFKQAKYEISQLYFDTAVNSLNKDFADYYVVENKQKSLKTLVGYLQTIAKEDSLQKVARLSDKDKMVLANKILSEKKKKIEAEKKKLEEQKAIQESNKIISDNLPGGFPGGAPPIGGQSTQWYFYNPATLSFGLSEFQKKWGNRKLEDNWRRSIKPVVTNLDEQSQSSDSIPKGDAAAIKKKVEYSEQQLDSIEIEKYLKNIPSTPELLTASTGKVIDAYYNCGTLYKEQLNDLNNASITFENLLRNYPESKYTVVTYYQLYRLFLVIPDEKKAEYYKNLILTKHPDSEYAAIINNPDLNAQKLSSKNKEEVYYEETYNLFVASNYLGTRERCQASDSLFPKSVYKPKYALLAALCLGKLEGKQNMIAALKKVSALYSNDAVKAKADEIIAILEKNGDATEAQSNLKSSLFKLDENEEHYYVLQIPMSASLNDVKNALAVFNTQNFGAENLKIDDLVFNEDKKMLVVKGIENSKKAMNYFDLIKDNKNITNNIPNDTLQQFIISQNNYLTLLKNQKETEAYSKFFKQNYLKI